MLLEQEVVLPVVVQKQQEVKRRRMTPVSISEITLTESGFLLKCTRQLCVSGKLKPIDFYLKADVS